MSKLQLSLACWDYDRTRALMDGRVSAEGIDLIYLPLRVEETFFRMQHFREFDVAEMSLSEYVLSLCSDSPPYIALPVFPSRFFRHSSIYVHSEDRVMEPKELAGKRVGIPEYHITAAVWIRGILAEYYSVPVNSVEYFTGGLEQAGRIPRLSLTLPDDIQIQPIESDQTLSHMLEAGQIDALYSARPPSSFAKASGGVRRLFEDYVSVERDYFQATGIFPIMHLIVVRRSTYERNPWIAQSLYKAFVEAKEFALRDLHEGTALKYMLPWLADAVQTTESIMGNDFWPYGLDGNRRTLETFVRYSAEQGLATCRLAPEDLFAPETLQSFRV